YNAPPVYAPAPPAVEPPPPPPAQSAAPTPAATAAPTPAEMPAPAAATAPGGVALDRATAQTILVQLVSERTGYPTEMLDPALDLEADLGIDSIKRVEIIGSFQQQTGIQLGAQVENLAARKTLAEMVEFLVTLENSPTLDVDGDGYATKGEASS